MGLSVKVKDLSMVFGTKNQIEEALKLIDEDKGVIIKFHKNILRRKKQPIKAVL